MTAKTKQAEATSTESTDQAALVSKFQGIGMKKLTEDHKNMSGVIRYLDSQGLSRGSIAKVVERKYQHVRNVLITPVGSKAAS